MEKRIDGVDKKTLRRWMREVCDNMLERNDREGIARFLHNQLDDDLSVLVEDYRHSLVR